MRPDPDTATQAASPQPDDEAAGGLRVAVLGTGHVGLVTAACLAALGHRVTAVDVDAQKIGRLACGDGSVHERGLEALVREQVAAKRLRFTTPAPAALRDAEFVFVAVRTPGRLDGSIDLDAIDAVADELCAVLRHPTVVVLQSTVPVGTARAFEAKLAKDCPAPHAPRVLSNPEFLREGCAVDDFMKPDRIIIGDDSPHDGHAAALLRRLYAPIADGVPVLTMDTRSAELSKYAANAMLALRISFINEIADIASATGADIEQVGASIGSDPRIGPHFLRPGLGFGGSCFPKDLAALRETARRHNVRSDILLAAQRVNARQRCWSLEALLRDLGSREALRGLRVALWGLAFKPGTDDVREAPSLVLLNRLSRAGAQVAAYDPLATANARAAVGTLPHLSWVDSAAQALNGADVLLLTTEWPEFVAFDPHEVAAQLARATVFDGRNALDAAAWSAAGLRVVQVGRAPLPRKAAPEGSDQAGADSATAPGTATSATTAAAAAAAGAPAADLATRRATSWIVTA